MAVVSHPASATEPSSVPDARPMPWRADLVFAVVLVVTMRVALSLYGWWRLHASPLTPSFFHGNWENLEPAPGSPGYVWLQPWLHLDALWYNEIAVNGYHPGDNTLHFPPLFPALSHLFMPLFGGSFGFAALTVCGLAVIAGFALLRRLAALDGRLEDGERAALYMCAFPVGFFLFAPFTEALFLALTVASFYLARTHRWWAAGICGFFATLTRWQGALLSPALLVEYVVQLREQKRRPGIDVIPLALPGIAYIAFTFYARYVVGEPRSMTQINQVWGIAWGPPWQVLSTGINWIAARGDGTELLNLVAILGVALACVLGAGYLRLSYLVFMAEQVLFAMTHVSMASPLASSSRYMLTVFPAFLLLGRVGSTSQRVNQAIVIVFFVLQGIFLWRFVTGEWVA